MPPATTGASAAAADLSKLDVCARVPEGTAEALTGETGFDADGRSSASSASCFWAVPRPGVGQYLEVEVSRRNTLADYTLTVNGTACPAAAVSGVGVEAVGGICAGAQTKVFLVGLNRGVAVQVIVNEPTAGLTPADLAAAANAVIAGLG